MGTPTPPKSPQLLTLVWSHAWQAFWCAALLNPSPALGVCKEMRHKVLEAEDGRRRVEWVYAAILDSIGRMKARRVPGPFEVEPPPKSA